MERFLVETPDACVSPAACVSPPPELPQMHCLLNQLKHLLTQAGQGYLEFAESCNLTIQSCHDAAAICERKATSISS